jgi:hypothetical protein
MKKLLILFLVALLVLSLCTCGPQPSLGGDKQPEKNSDEQSGLTLAALKQKATDLGFEVSELTSMQKGAYLKIVDGFNVSITEDSYSPVYEMASQADAEDTAKKENAAGYNIPFVNGKFYATVPKDDSAQESGMSALLGVSPSTLK